MQLDAVSTATDVDLPEVLAESWEFRVGCPQTAVAMRSEWRT